ncbi:MAG: hypothetical protein AAGF57_11690, partial [Pseudomonadota bacterium]
MRTNLTALFPLSLMSAALLQVAPSIAQENIMLEEVVVTAQRREQNLQDVPVSLTAFSGETLEERNIKSSIEYLAIT